MKNPPIHSITEQAHRMLSEFLKEGDRVVDATCGNGNDTLWLAEQIGPKGELWAVDVQKQAICRSKDLIKTNGIQTPLHWVQNSHENWAEILPVEVRGDIKAFVYNLGYLPGGDKNLTTTVSASVKSILDALEWLSPGGVISICSYRGHDEGMAEYKELIKVLGELPKSKAHVVEYRLVNHDLSAPALLMVQRKA